MPTLKELLGSSYKDGMTVEEIDTALSTRNLIDSSLTPVIDKSTFDKTASELAKYKKELNDLKGKNLTAEEQVAQALKEAQDAKSNYAKELAKVKATEVLIKAGLSEKDYAGILPGIVSEDAEHSVNLATELSKLISSQRQSVEQKVRQDLLQGTPKPPGGTPGANYDAQLQAAMERGDMLTMASLIRQQASQLPK